MYSFIQHLGVNMIYQTGKDLKKTVQDGVREYFNQSSSIYRFFKAKTFIHHEAEATDLLEAIGGAEGELDIIVKLISQYENLLKWGKSKSYLPMIARLLCSELACDFEEWKQQYRKYQEAPDRIERAACEGTTCGAFYVPSTIKWGFLDALNERDPILSAAKEQYAITTRINNEGSAAISSANTSVSERQGASFASSLKVDPATTTQSGSVDLAMNHQAKL